MNHVAAYTANKALSATMAILNALGGVGDRTTNNRHLFNRDWLLVAFYAQGATITRAQIVAPNVTNIRNWQMPFVELAAAPSDLPNINDLRGMPLPIRRETEYEVDTTNTALEQEVALLFLSDGVYSEAQGNALTTRLTTTGVTVANTWSNLSMTPDDTFPPGTYTLNNVFAISTTGSGFRIRFPNNDQQLCPGGICRTGRGNNPGGFDPGRDLGSLGLFSNVSLFTIEFLCTAAETPTEVFAQCVGPF